MYFSAVNTVKTAAFYFCQIKKLNEKTLDKSQGM